jgi:hypothetical protein
VIFIFDSIFSLLDFLFLGINLQLSHCNLLYHLSHKCLLLVNFSYNLFFVSFCFLKQINCLSEQSFILHSTLNGLGQFFFILFF